MRPKMALMQPTKMWAVMDESGRIHTIRHDKTIAEICCGPGDRMVRVLITYIPPSKGDAT